ncbi:MAG TPA: HlyD family efflux transporter periplasmic adaptor subunit [Pelobium sp.]
MRKMWSDSLLGRLIESRCKYQESRRLFSGATMPLNCENKSIFLGRIRTHYSPFTNYLIKFFLAVIFLSACNSDSKKVETNKQYTCSMHPQIVENEPGSCPVCGMDLTPIRVSHHTTHSADSILAINNMEPSSKTMIVKESTQTPEISMDGSITYNTNQMKSISARVSGRIEKSFVKYNFEPVKKGQLLVQVYSPELVAIQQELLFLKSKNDTELLNSTKAKLALLGIGSRQINQVLKIGKADYKINIYSNYNGYLLNPNTDKKEEVQLANTPLTVKEGQYINSGDLLFKVFNNSNLWVEFYTNTLANDWLKVGTKLSLEINKENIETKVNFIQPFFKNNQNYKLVRVLLNNQKHQYKIGELARATAKASPISGIWIPEQAVYQSGEKNIVYVKIKNEIQPKEVEIAAKANKQILIKKGLKSGDEIAVNASYLKDSESFISKK